MSSKRFPLERRSHASVYVGNLPDNVTEGEVEDLLYKYGRIRDIDVKRGRSANGTAYAFVEFDHPRDAEDAVERCDGISYAGQRLRVEFTGDKKPKRRDGFTGPPQRRSEYRVVVSGIPQGCRWQHLKDHMRKAGEVGYANVDHGRGIVEYLNRDDMQYALTKLDGTEMQAFHSTTRIRVKHVLGGLERSDYRDPSRRRSRSRSRDRDMRGRSGSFDQSKRERRSYSYERRRRDEPNSRENGGGRRSTSRSRSEYREYPGRDTRKLSERPSGSYEKGGGRAGSPYGGSEAEDEGRRVSGSEESRLRDDLDRDGDEPPRYDTRHGRGSDEVRDYYDVAANRMKFDGR